MVRGLFDAIALFLMPFAAYAAFLAIRRRLAPRFGAWGRGPLLRLVIAGLTAAVFGVLLGGIFGSRYLGTYVPAHLDHGVLIPGRMN